VQVPREGRVLVFLREKSGPDSVESYTANCISLNNI
jgi:hypothetical protein